MNDEDFVESVLNLAEFASFNATFAEMTQNLKLNWGDSEL